MFPEILALPIIEPPNKLGNIILLASYKALKPLRVPEDNVTLDPNWRYGPGYAKIHAWDNRFVEDITNAQIFTDDLNGVDILSEKVNAEARKDLHTYFSKTNLSW